MKKETKVNCEVETCKHNEKKHCDLDELDISCTCNNEDCSDKLETICNNFEKNETNDDTCEETEYDLPYENDIEKEKSKKEYIELEEDF